MSLSGLPSPVSPAHWYVVVLAVMSSGCSRFRLCG